MGLEIGFDIYKKEKDDISINRLKEIDTELTKLKSEESSLRTSWEEEKEVNKNAKKAAEDTVTAFNKNFKQYLLQAVHTFIASSNRGKGSNEHQ